MAKTTINKSRRDAVKLMLAGMASVPLINLVHAAAAQAEDLPQLSEDDPSAKALNYVHDATAANRVDKGGTPASEQLCSNCQFIQAGEGEWLPCALFPGKVVNANGWCVSWMPKVS
ncbi:MAG: high-potential iron-sulfur protein [Gammaproteobacteria bacterium]